MIHHEYLSPTISLLRFFSEDSSYGDEYSALAVLIWLDPRTIEVRGFKGEMTPRMYTNLVRWLVNVGAETIKAQRMGRHKLPGSVLQGDGYWHLDVKKFAERRFRPIR